MKEEEERREKREERKRVEEDRRRSKVSSATRCVSQTGRSDGERAVTRQGARHLREGSRLEDRGQVPREDGGIGTEGREHRVDPRPKRSLRDGGVKLHVRETGVEPAQAGQEAANPGETDRPHRDGAVRPGEHEVREGVIAAERKVAQWHVAVDGGKGSKKEPVNPIDRPREEAASAARGRSVWTGGPVTPHEVDDLRPKRGDAVEGATGRVPLPEVEEKAGQQNGSHTGAAPVGVGREVHGANGGDGVESQA